jgi:hypothetical protein
MSKMVKLGYLALALGISTGCQTIKPRETHTVKSLEIIFDDFDGVNEAYQLYTMGLRPDDKVLGFEANGKIYCVHDDDETLGHELRHVIYGKTHKEGRR